MKEIIEQICEELPPNWIVSLKMENGSAWIEIDEIDYDPKQEYSTLEEELLAALAAVKEMDKYD